MPPPLPTPPAGGRSGPAPPGAVSRREGQALAASVDGSVFLPDDDGFAARAGLSGGDGGACPAVVVAAGGTTDVCAAVRFAAVRGLPVDVRATGSGRSSVRGDGVVLVATARMDRVAVDTRRRTVRVGAGARWEQVVARAAPHGLAPVAGPPPAAGVVGYTLGGGPGIVPGAPEGAWEPAVRHVVGFQIVTGDGEIRYASADHAPDLFRAVCGTWSGVEPRSGPWSGAGSRPGIVTSLTFGLFPAA